MDPSFFLAILFGAIVCSALLWEFRNDFPQDTNKTQDMVVRGLILGLGSVILALFQGFTAGRVLVWFVSGVLLWWPVFDEIMNVRLGRPFADSRDGPSFIDSLFARFPKFAIQSILLVSWMLVVALNKVAYAVLTVPFFFLIALSDSSFRKTARAYWIPMMSAQAVICFLCGKAAIDLMPDWEVSDGMAGLVWLAPLYLIVFLLSLTILIWPKKK